jgi:N-acetyl-anhydromuramoyl-L-alanine amidase
MLIAMHSIDPNNGIMRGARQVHSPNQDARPDGVVADLIVIHGISLPPGEFGGPWIDQLFTNSLPLDRHPYFAQVGTARVSSHLLIRRDGEVVQYVGFDRRAWHAGRSSYSGRPSCNDFSIGIELEGSDTVAYEAEQYRVLAQVVVALCRAYPQLSPQRIAGHSDVSPGRKTDPGESFDWRNFHRRLAAALTSASDSK